MPDLMAIVAVTALAATLRSGDPPTHAKMLAVAGGLTAGVLLLVKFEAGLLVLVGLGLWLVLARTSWRWRGAPVAATPAGLLAGLLSAAPGSGAPPPRHLRASAGVGRAYAAPLAYEAPGLAW